MDKLIELQSMLVYTDEPLVSSKDSKFSDKTKVCGVTWKRIKKFAMTKEFQQAWNQG